MKICSKCGVKTKVYNTFGKLKCKPCIDKSKTGRKGHSGMIYNKSTSIPLSLFNDGLKLECVKKSNDLFVKWYIEHYPQSKGIVGRQINYLIYDGHSPIGIISGSSPPLNYLIFRKYFKITNDLQFLNNNVYRIVTKTDDKNLGTKILKLFRNTIIKDYYDKYKTNLLGLVTFVEPPRTGAIYKADNWEFLGETQGITVRRKGDNWFDKQYLKGVKKLIFAYKYK
jgi:hypothetical protein|tara:strand:- start:75 stop:749 length:675 start_codon:yes stop_codon:yes gene_type:complete